MNNFLDKKHYFCGVKALLSKITSILLITALAFGSFPLSFHHDHEDEGHCHHDTGLYEVDPCHLSVYHSEEAEDIHCEHNSHYAEEDNDCDWCSLLTTKRHKYNLPLLQAFESNIKVVFLDFDRTEFIVKSAVSLNPGRAPPAKV